MKRKAVCIALLALACMTGTTADQFTRELKLSRPRMNGDDVRTLQEKLLATGFAEVGEVDGWFGPNTDLAVKRYQKLTGFPPDGLVTREAWEAFFPTGATNAEMERTIREINGIKKTGLDLEQLDFGGHSLEGGYIDRYRKSGKTVLVEACLFGEMYKLVYDVYHVESGTVIMVTHYKYPALFDLDHAVIEVASHYFTKTLSVSVSNGVAAKAVISDLDIEPELLE